MPETHSRLNDIKKGGRSFRSASIQTIDIESRTVQLAFSSEAEVQRWWGVEVLDHSPGAVVMDRLIDGAPLLLEHDTNRQIGVVEEVSIEGDRRGRATVRFGKGELAEEIFQDVQDKIRKHVSVGYVIHEAKLTEERDDGDVWTITSWEPVEISFVAVPADISVGVGRAIEPEIKSENTEKPINSRNLSMPDPVENSQTNTEALSIAERKKGSEAERARISSIMAMGEKFGAAELARSFINEGHSVEDFNRALLDQINDKAKQPLSEQTRHADIGMTDKECQRFSFIKVIRALSDPTDRRAHKDAAFEFESSQVAAEKLGQNNERFVIPTDVLTRALNTGTSGAASGDTGGFGIATNLMVDSFIEILRKRTTIMQLSSVLGGLVGNIDIPKQVAAAQGYWIGEDDDAVESMLDLGQISMTPKTVAAFSEITRKLMLQSSLDVEAMVRADLAKALALSIDKAGYYGTGGDHQPLGVSHQTGVNATVFAGVQPSFVELVDMETQISLDDADVSTMAYIGNAAFRGHSKTTLKFPDSAVGGTIWENGGTVNGYRAEITNQISTGDVFMGNFSDLIVGMWSGLQLMVDPYSGSKKGRLRVTVFQDVDFGLRRVESFAVGRKAV